MGFDISGINPKINKPITDYKLYGSDKDAFELSEKDRKVYFKEMDDYNKANPGVYFRNNVWFWRPLWGFVGLYCSEFLTEEDLEGGSFNNGHRITQEQAAKIGTKLTILLEDGTVDKHVEKIKERNEKLNKGNKDEQFLASYPFERDNVEEFTKFCLESGGFEIW